MCWDETSVSLSSKPTVCEGFGQPHVSKKLRTSWEVWCEHPGAAAKVDAGPSRGVGTLLFKGMYGSKTGRFTGGENCVLWGGQKCWEALPAPMRADVGATSNIQQGCLLRNGHALPGADLGI